MLTKAHTFLIKIKEDQYFQTYGSPKDRQIFEIQFKELDSDDKQQWFDSLLASAYHEFIFRQDIEETSRRIVLITKYGSQSDVQLSDPQTFILLLVGCWVNNFKLSPQKRQKNAKILHQLDFEIKSKIKTSNRPTNQLKGKSFWDKISGWLCCLKSNSH